ncbi:hypothetical protein ACWDTT_33265 [Streptosporangium sandarakinum]
MKYPGNTNRVATPCISLQLPPTKSPTVPSNQKSTSESAVPLSFLQALAAPEFDPAQLLVFGPAVAVVVFLFVKEIIVPGPAYARETAENERLQKVIESVIPLAQEMVAAAKQNSAALEDVVEVLERVTETLTEARNPRA